MTTANWIKMRTDLRNHPKVVRISTALKAERLRVIGGLWAVWGTFDTHSEDGLLDGYTFAAIDEDLGWRGFAQAMADVAWLDEVDDGLVIPEFEEHNGASAKRRATDSKRKADGRDSDKTYGGSWKPDGEMSASHADKKQTRVRVEREKKTSSSVRATRRCPDEFEIPDTLKAEMRCECPSVDIEREAKKFRDHTFATARSDWPATFRNWIRTAADRGKPANGMHQAGLEGLQ